MGASRGVPARCACCGLCCAGRRDTSPMQGTLSHRCTTAAHPWAPGSSTPCRSIAPGHGCTAAAGISNDSLLQVLCKRERGARCGGELGPCRGNGWEGCMAQGWRHCPAFCRQACSLVRGGCMCRLNPRLGCPPVPPCLHAQAAAAAGAARQALAG